MTDAEVEQVISASKILSVAVTWRLDASPEALDLVAGLGKKLLRKRSLILKKSTRFRGTLFPKAASSYVLSYEIVFFKPPESENGTLAFLLAHQPRPKGPTPPDINEGLKKGQNTEWFLEQLRGVKEVGKRFLFEQHAHIEIPQIRPRYFDSLPTVEITGARFSTTGIEFTNAAAVATPTSEGLIGFQISDDENDAELSDLHLNYRRWADDLDSPDREVAEALRWARTVLKDC